MAWLGFAGAWLLGGFLALGGEVPDSPEEIRRLAEAGDAGAQYQLARMHLEGNGVEKDDAQGMAWLKKAAGQGMPEAQYRLALCLKKGTGGGTDAAGARRWLEEAARNGHQTARALTADPESREGLRWRAQKGNRTAQRKLGWGLLVGNGACLAGSLHRWGGSLSTAGSEEEVAEGLKWLAEAAQRGDAEAARMSAWYFQKRDEEKAFYWWNRAADLGLREAQWTMVRRCRAGLGTRASETDAVRWCRKLAEGGDVRAMRALGAAYELGRGCIKDFGEAKRWYGRAGDVAGVQRMEKAVRRREVGEGTGFSFKSKDVRIHGAGGLPRHVK